MGLFDALSDLASAVVKTALTPIAIAKDAVEVVTGGESDNTKELLKAAAKDLSKIGDDLTGDF